jgi:3-hydroxy acid dehydrogenase/malonic semialdehyde reductase
MEKTMNDSDKALDGRKIIVTGGTTGIGRATAIELAKRGASLFIFGRHQEELDDALAAVRKAGGKVEGQTAEQSNHNDIRLVFDKAQEKLGGLDAVIANAGLAAEGIETMPDEKWRYVVDVNHAVDVFDGREGDIILVGSVASDEGEPETSVYAATKAGVAGFAGSFRKECAKKNIRVSLIEPGAVGSDMQEGGPEEQRKKIKKAEMLKAEDVAELVSFILTRPQRCTISEVRIEPRITN